MSTRPPAVARLWPPIFILALFWTIYALWRWTELGPSFGFAGFLVLAGGGALVTLSFIIWWLAASKLERFERYAVFGVAMVSGGWHGALRVSYSRRQELPGGVGSFRRT